MLNVRAFKFRVLLPLVNIVLAITLLACGRFEMLREVRLRQASGPYSDPVPGEYERARYVSYALNVPAWAAQLRLPPILHIKGSPYWGGEGAFLGAIENEHDWWYLLFVGILWWYMGLRLDRSTSRPRARENFFERRVVPYIVGIAGCVILLIAPNIAPPFMYEKWFIDAVWLWGIGLVGAGIYLFFRQPGEKTPTISSH